VSDPTIDVTRRTRIRALAVRMRRAGIAGVFSTAGGVLAVDEGALTDDQRQEATKILKEVSADLVALDDVETASSVAAMIPRYIKPSCPICQGGGLVRGGVDDFCVCVDRRWQAAIDHQAFIDNLRAPGRAFGACVKSTRAVDDQKRIAAARGDLNQARVVQVAACAELDGEIKELETVVAPYFAERGQLDASRIESGVLAAEQERLAGGYAQAVEEVDAIVEEIALHLGELIRPLFRATTTGFVDDDRARAHSAVDAVYAAAAEAGHRRVDRKGAEEAAQQERSAERVCEQRIAALDADNVSLVDKIERLRAVRARIARHHQPKIDRAEKRLRRLTYLAGSAGGIIGEAQAEPREELEER